MKIVNYEEKYGEIRFPEGFAEKLEGKEPEEQMKHFRITKNTVENGEFVVDGQFGKPNIMSESLKRRLIQYGVPQDELSFFLKEQKEEDTA